MADNVQKVIYKIVVDSSGVAEQVAAARAKIEALRGADDNLHRSTTQHANERHRIAEQEKADLKAILDGVEKTARARQEADRILASARQSVDRNRRITPDDLRGVQPSPAADQQAQVARIRDAIRQATDRARTVSDMQIANAIRQATDRARTLDDVRTRGQVAAAIRDSTQQPRTLEDIRRRVTPPAAPPAPPAPSSTGGGGGPGEYHPVLNAILAQLQRIAEASKKPAGRSDAEPRERPTAVERQAAAEAERQRYEQLVRDFPTQVHDPRQAEREARAFENERNRREAGYIRDPNIARTAADIEATNRLQSSLDEFNAALERLRRQQLDQAHLEAVAEDRARQAEAERRRYEQEVRDFPTQVHNPRQAETEARAFERERNRRESGYVTSPDDALTAAQLEALERQQRELDAAFELAHREAIAENKERERQRNELHAEALAENRRRSQAQATIDRLHEQAIAEDRRRIRAAERAEEALNRQHLRALRDNERRDLAYARERDEVLNAALQRQRDERNVDRVGPDRRGRPSRRFRGAFDDFETAREERESARLEAYRRERRLRYDVEETNRRRAAAFGDPVDINQERRERSGMSPEDERRQTSRLRRDAGYSIFDALFGGSEGKWTRWQKIIAIVLTIIVAMIPAVAALAGAIGGLTAALTIAIAAVGAFAIAAIGNLVALKKAIENTQKTGQELPERFKTIGEAFFRIKDAYNDFTRVTSGAVFAPLVDVINVLLGVLPRLTGVVFAASDGIREGFAGIGAALNSARFEEFVGVLERTAAPTIDAFIDTLRDLVAGFGELAISFEPFLSFFTGGLAKMAASFKEWAASLRGTRSDEFDEFMAYVRIEGPRVVDTIAALAGILIKLGIAFSDIGEILLKAIRGFNDLLGVLAKLHILKAIVVMFVGFLVFSRIIALVVGLVVGISRLISVLQLLHTALFRVFVQTRSVEAANAAASRSITAMGAAVGGLAAVLAIAAIAWSLYSAKQEEAKAKSEANRRAMYDLAKEMAANEGELTEQTQESLLDKYANDRVEGSGFWERANQRLFRRHYEAKPALYEEDTTVLDEAKKAGINASQLVAGTTDTEDRNAVIDQFERKIAELRQKAKDAGADGDAAGRFEGQADMMQNALEAYKGMTFTSAQLAKAQQDLGLRVRDATGALTEQEKAALRLKEKLKTLGEETDDQKAIKAAIDARKEYLEAIEAQSDAERENKRLHEDYAQSVIDIRRKTEDAENRYTDALERQRRAQEDLTRAREDAYKTLERLRDKVRDNEIDSEQVQINLRRSQQRYEEILNDPNATEDDIKEALLDVKRAQNAVEDQGEQSVYDQKDLDRAEADGIEQSRAVIDAKRELRDSIREAAEAYDAYLARYEVEQRAIEDLNEDLDDSDRNVTELRDRTAEAGIQMEILAAKAGTVAGGIDSIRYAHQMMREEMQKELNTKAIDDFVGRAETALMYQKAFQILDANPGMSVTEAISRARQDMENAKRDEKHLAPGGFQGHAEGGAIGPNVGGAVDGPGTITSDSVPALLSAGEHVWTAVETAMLGGHRVMESLRRAVKDGRFSTADVRGFLSGAGYQLSASDIVASSDASSVMRRAGIKPQKLALGGPVFDIGSMYAGFGNPGLNLPSAAISAPMQSIGSVTNNSGFRVENVNIHNPTQEPSGESMYRTIRRLAFEYE